LEKIFFKKKRQERERRREREERERPRHGPSSFFPHNLLHFPTPLE